VAVPSQQLEQDALVEVGAVLGPLEEFNICVALLVQPWESVM
jgi:hypothetical protein